MWTQRILTITTRKLGTLCYGLNLQMMAKVHKLKKKIKTKLPVALGRVTSILAGTRVDVFRVVLT